ncbi:MAG: AAA family ATPase [Lachnospiraceae bacterium]|nr:AAA family ATPase [Lachnospiraceae bacterium]
MNTTQKKIPIGIEDFEKLRKNGFYYVDKTGLIIELLQNPAEVTLFTRPRRFGKSLNMSMLKYFFELDGNKELFEGLEIMEEPELCEEYMGKFPVISLSLKDIDAESYETAFEMAAMLMNREAGSHRYLLESEFLATDEKEAFSELLDRKMNKSVFCGSIALLSRLLEKHHNRKVVILIDEYDVPLARAHAQGYYEQMIVLIRSFFHQALKSNKSIQLAVLTGCMRISKESIFTGLNNLNVLTVADARQDERFGFTDEEVKELLHYYGLSDKYSAIREWYDGYRFGDVEIYCPWDVINYCALLRADPTALPENYWANSSGNDVVRRFLREAGDNKTVKREIERLIAGEIVTKEIHQEITYSDMYGSIDNIWSVLFATGYLTQRGRGEERSFQLAIPNLEVREIFTGQIMDMFKEDAKKDGESLDALCIALQDGDAKETQYQLRNYLKKTISIRDTFARRELKENFYHGMLLGLLAFKGSWVVSSNREAGEGYADILVEIDDDEPMGLVIEVKYARDGNLDASCQEALAQIKGRQYGDAFYDEDIEKVLKYGVAFYKNKCKVMCQKAENLS